MALTTLVGASLLLIAGLYILVKASDIFVESSIKIARRLGVKEFLIGLTLVAAGTSFPELIASIIAAAEGYGGIVIGNVLGSNIANHGLILGIVAITSPFALKKNIFAKESIIVIAVSIILGALVIIGAINTASAILLLIGYIAYVIYVLNAHKTEQEEFTNVEEVGKTYAWWQETSALAVSGVGVWVGAELVIRNVVQIAQSIGLSEAVIAGTIVAIGTSLPELSVCMSAAKKNKPELILGNIMGSSIANILLILGVAGMLTHIHFRTAEIMMYLVMLVLVAMSAWYVHQRTTLKRKHGIILVSIYAAFVIVSFLV